MFAYVGSIQNLKDLKDRDPLLHSERVQGFAADPDYWKGEVFAYVGLPQNLKDLKKKVPVSAYVGSSKNLKDLKDLKDLKRT